MNNETDFDYGPLTNLIGTWKGNKGIDIAPEPDGIENNPYYETIIFEPIGDVTNAESQILMALQYRQVVRRKSTDKVFHDESGYWMWDSRSETIMHSFTIPRAVCVLAGGKHTGSKNKDGSVTLEVSANVDDSQWGIIQSPFMQDNARTTEFRHHITVGNGKLSYSETTIVDIYGKIFEHTDDNDLLLQ
ncbi:MAG: FABP family protein [Gammaproteobacteria bacterium]|nr:FABP family protein [Gammaproteobacteria bacterium]